MKRNVAGFTSQCHPEFNSGSRCLDNKRGEMPNQVWHDTSLGFTLIELLVVVLIIGILAAIALPQYQKAVEKSRLSKAYVALSALQKQMELHIIENGTDTFNLFAQNPEQGDLKIPGCEIVATDESADRFCAHKDFLYEAYCSSHGVCYVNAFRYKKADYSDIREHYALSWARPNTQTWFQNCYWHDNMGKNMCNSLTGLSNIRTF